MNKNKIWEDSEISVSSLVGKSVKSFTNKDWGVVNHLYKMRKKSSYTSKNMVDRVVDTALWGMVQGKISEDLFSSLSDYAVCVKKARLEDPSLGGRDLKIKALFLMKSSNFNDFTGEDSSGRALIEMYESMYE